MLCMGLTSLEREKGGRIARFCLVLKEEKRCGGPVSCGK